MGVIKRFIGLCLALSLCFGVALGWLYHDYQSRPVGTQAHVSNVLIERGSGWTQIVAQLSAAGVVDRQWPFYWYGRFSGQVAKIQAGEYAIEPGLSVDGLLARLTSGKVIQRQFTIIEGWNVRQMLEGLKRLSGLQHTLSATTAVDLAAELALPVAHAEGWFLPETYAFTRGETDRALLLRAHQAMRQTLDEVWTAREENLPLNTSQDALILASIIEKETGLAAERPRIAGVFVLRLRKGMLLQTDPTVIYGIGPTFDGNIRRRDLRRDTPYNTYTRAGLTPTPIALPGRAALQAAVHPDVTGELYFVADGSGGHTFSKTLAQHNRAVRKYQLGR